jgi:hypothetical protein
MRVLGDSDTGKIYQKSDWFQAHIAKNREIKNALIEEEY